MVETNPLAVAFLAPGLAVAGLVLAGVPILIHILNRRRYKVVSWAAMDFLLRAMKKNRRRLRFESFLLLAARCALLGLLGLALAQPFGCQPNALAALAGHRSGLHVFVIDNAYAMGYQYPRPQAKTHLDQAKIIVKQMISRLASGSDAVVILAEATPPAGAVQPLPSPTYDLDAALSAVDSVQQRYTPADLPGTLERAERVAETSNDLPTKTLYLLDDSSRSLWTGADANVLSQLGHDLAQRYDGGIFHFNLGKPDEYNPLVQTLTSSQPLTTLVEDFAPSFRANVRAYGAGAPARLIWKIDDVVQDAGSSQPIALDLTGQDQTLARPLFSGAGAHVISASLQSDDALPCDDSRWKSVNVIDDLKMLIVEGERQNGATGSSGVNLHAALAPDPQATDTPAAHLPGLVAIDTISDLELGGRPLDDYRCIALCGVGNISPSVAERLHQWVNQGGALWIFMGPQVGSENYNQTLWKEGLLPGPLIQRISLPVAEAGRKFDFDVNNPSRVLEAFRGQERTGLENARVFTYWQVDLLPGNHVEHILDYQPDPASGRKDPAFTLQSVGRGKVVFCSTTANANEDWTAFPAKIAFPEVMLCLLLNTVNTDDQWMNLSVGDAVQTPAGIKLTGVPALRDAEGQPLAMDEYTDSTGQTSYQSGALEKPGVYTLTAGAQTWPISVNVDPVNSDLRLTDGAAITKALGGITIGFVADAAPAVTADSEANSEFAWSILCVVLVLLGGESMLAMYFGRRRRI